MQEQHINVTRARSLNEQHQQSHPHHEELITHAHHHYQSTGGNPVRPTFLVNPNLAISKPISIPQNGSRNNQHIERRASGSYNNQALLYSFGNCAKHEPRFTEGLLQSNSSDWNQSHNYNTSNKAGKKIQFIDQTAGVTNGFRGKKRSHQFVDEYSVRKRPTAVKLPKKSHAASMRKRDASGHFLPKGVAIKIEDLEHKLNKSENECNHLRNKLTERESELMELRKKLKDQETAMKRNEVLLHRLSQPLPPQAQLVYAAPPVAHGVVPMMPYASNMINHAYIPGPIEPRAAFQKQIDLSKKRTELRKTHSSFASDAEKREQVSKETEWETRTGRNDLIRRSEQYNQWQHNIRQQQAGEIPLPEFDIFPAGEKEEEGMDTNYSPIYYQFPDTDSLSDQTMDDLSPQMVDSQLSPQMVDAQQLCDDAASDNVQMNQAMLGGPPSDIYTPPDKIGNRLVAAFAKKINFSEIQLKKTDSPYSSPPD